MIAKLPPMNTHLLKSIHSLVSFLSGLVEINLWKKDYKPFPAPALFGTSSRDLAQLIMSPYSLYGRKAHEEKVD